jgi:hypothetical protein
MDQLTSQTNHSHAIRENLILVRMACNANVSGVESGVVSWWRTVPDRDYLTPKEVENFSTLSYTAIAIWLRAAPGKARFKLTMMGPPGRFIELELSCGMLRSDLAPAESNERTVRLVGWIGTGGYAVATADLAYDAMSAGWRGAGIVSANLGQTIRRFRVGEDEAIYNARRVREDIQIQLADYQSLAYFDECNLREALVDARNAELQLRKVRHARLRALRGSVAVGRSLHNAAQRVDAATVRHLLSTGVPTDQRDDDGRTALHLAVRPSDGSPRQLGRQLAAADVLLGYGADPNASAHDGRTPLHAALDRLHSGAPVQPALIELLLAHGANASARSVYGDRPGDRRPGEQLHIQAGESVEEHRDRVKQILNALRDARKLGR